MKIKVNGVRDLYYLTLGAQTTAALLEETIHKNVKYWAPKKAKSYTILNRYGVPADFQFEVEYYTGATEGKVRLAP